MAPYSGKSPVMLSSGDAMTITSTFTMGGADVTQDISKAVIRRSGPAPSYLIGLVCEGCGTPIAHKAKVQWYENFGRYLASSRYKVWHDTCTPERLDKQLAELRKKVETGGWWGHWDR